MISLVLKTVVSFLFLVGYAMAQGDAPWRSSMYPEDWRPGFADEHGRFVHDFSYAGYQFGEREIPDQPPGRLVDATAAPYHADPSGERDSTAAIQQALDAVGEAGGGVVRLPAGTYRVQPPRGENDQTARQALAIRHSGVVLRGDGPDRTFLFNADPIMRGRTVIRVLPGTGNVGWTRPGEGGATPLAADVPNQAWFIRLASVEGWSRGDWLVLRTDCTEDFVREISPRMVEHWPGKLSGMLFYRQVVGIDPATGRLALDIPLRFRMLRRDNARVYRVPPHLTEVGVEDLSIGMQEHTGTSGWGFNDYRRQGNSAYDVHGAYIIVLNHVVHGWVRRVHSYHPPTNRTPRHMVSNGIQLSWSRNVTVRDCDLRQAQFRGGGGNGYGYVFQGSDNLITRSRGEELRYVFDFKSMQSTGNVVHRSESQGVSDFHMHLSAANLLDNVRVTGGYLNAAWRGGAGTTPHGQTTTDTTFWNIHGAGAHPHVISVGGQSGHSHIVGTSGPRDAVRGLSGNHAAWFEGRGRGAMLQPQSLYEDQLRRRLQLPAGRRSGMVGN